MKVLVNKCYGGFGLSEEALRRAYDLGVKELARPFEREKDPMFASLDKAGDDKESIFYKARTPDGKLNLSWHNLPYDEENKWRSHPLIIQAVEEIGIDKASSRMAEVQIVEIPDDVQWEIQEYDGMEWVAEKHRTW